jgi:hypothetical protein
LIDAGINHSASTGVGFEGRFCTHEIEQNRDPTAINPDVVLLWGLSLTFYICASNIGNKSMSTAAIAPAPSTDRIVYRPDGTSAEVVHEANGVRLILIRAPMDDEPVRRPQALVVEFVTTDTLGAQSWQVVHTFEGNPRAKILGVDDLLLRLYGGLGEWWKPVLEKITK